VKIQLKKRHELSVLYSHGKALHNKFILKKHVKQVTIVWPLWMFI